VPFISAEGERSANQYVRNLVGGKGNLPRKQKTGSVEKRGKKLYSTGSLIPGEVTVTRGGVLKAYNMQWG